MECKNITSIELNGDNINKIINKQEDLQTSDLNTSCATIDIFKRAVLEAVYPVGSVYINYSSSTSPKSVLGFGTWEKVTNRYIRAANTTSGAGGEDFVTLNMMPSHNHTVTLTTPEAGKHTHEVVIYKRHDGNDGSLGEHMASPDQNSGNKYETIWKVTTEGAHSHTVTGNTGNTGTNSVRNLPTYQSFHIWHRTA